MSRFLATLALTALVGSASAEVICSDSLYISRLRQFTLNFRDVNPNSWDSVEVPITQITDARSLSMAPIADTSELVFPVQFFSNCTPDSNTEVSFLRLRDIGSTVRGTDTWKSVNDVYKAKDSALSYGKVSLGSASFNGFWEVGKLPKIYQTGQLPSQSPASYHLQFQSFRYKGGTGSYTYSAWQPQTLPMRTMAFSNVADYIDGLHAALDSVGHGLDSVRVSARITEVSFDYVPTNWSATTGVYSRASRKPAFASYRTSHGYVFVLPHPTALTVLSAEGRVVRTLAASTAPMWDGMDAAGHRVNRGVYLVRGLGLGVIRILL